MGKCAAVWVYDSLGHGERQRKKCDEVARSFDYKTCETIMSDQTGRDKAWGILASLVDRGGVDMVFAYDPSRIGASSEEYEDRKGFLESAGVALYLINPE